MAFVSASWPSSVDSPLLAIASRRMCRSGKLPSTDSINALTSSGRSGSRSAPGPKRFSEEIYLPLPGLDGPEDVLPRILFAEHAATHCAGPPHTPDAPRLSPRGQLAETLLYLSQSISSPLVILMRAQAAESSRCSPRPYLARPRGRNGSGG